MHRRQLIVAPTPDQVPHAFLHAANSVLDPITGASLTYTQLCLGPDG
jgi:hypothetical protein